MKASVGASFPSSQTYLGVKINEVNRILEEGADEVDIVISVGKFLAGKYEEVFNEISEIKKQMGNKHLKVILETGVLKDPALPCKKKISPFDESALNKTPFNKTLSSVL